MHKVLTATLAMLLIGLANVVYGQSKTSTIKLPSPNKQVEIAFALDATDTPTYAVSYRRQPVIVTSTLGLEFKQGGLLSRGLSMTGMKRHSANQTYTLVVGKTKQARDHYNEVIVSLEEKQSPQRKLDVVFRAYDDGAAFRYLIPRQAALNGFELTSERSEFRFPADYTSRAMQLGKFTSNYEATFDKINLSQIKPEAIVGLPLVVQVPNRMTVALAEANLMDYAGMYIGGAQGGANTLISKLSPLPESDVCVRGSSSDVPHHSPWRAVMIGDEPGRLIESTLILHLNKPNSIADTSWIRPGKTAWDWWSDQVVKNADVKSGMNDATMKHYIDFAAETNLEYMLIDAGW